MGLFGLWSIDGRAVHSSDEADRLMGDFAIGLLVVIAIGVIAELCGYTLSVALRARNRVTAIQSARPWIALAERTDEGPPQSRAFLFHIGVIPHDG